MIRGKPLINFYCNLGLSQILDSCPSSTTIFYCAVGCDAFGFKPIWSLWTNSPQPIQSPWRNGPQNFGSLNKWSPINLVPVFPNPHRLSPWTKEYSRDHLSRGTKLVGGDHLSMGTKFLGTICSWGTELVGDCLSRGTNQLGTHCGGTKRPGTICIWDQNYQISTLSWWP